MSNPNPSFYAVIPAPILYCKDIEPGAKLLYGTLTSLAAQEGYCWATNKYLGDLYGVDQKTVQRWISSLQKQKFIACEIDRSGFQTIRRIWISPDIKRIFTARQKCREGETKVVRPEDKNVLQINNIDIHIEKKENAASQLADLLLQKIKSIKPDFTKQTSPKWLKDFVKLLKLRSEDQIKKIITWIFETSTWKWNEIILSPGNLLKHLDQIEMQMTNKSSGLGHSKDWVEKLKIVTKSSNEISFGSDHIAFSFGQSHKIIKFTDHAYQDQIKNQLRKMNISIEGL